MTLTSPRWLELAGAIILAGCASGSGSGTSGQRDPLRPLASERSNAGSDSSEFATIYTRMGLAASGAPLFFVGDAAYFATRTPDTTIVVVGLSLPNRGLVFKHNQGIYDAGYQVDLSLSNAQGLVRQASDTEQVRVTTFKETSRTDESVIYRRAFRIPPGSYTLAYVVRDDSGHRGAERKMAIDVPRFGGSGLSTIEPVYEAQSRVRLDSAPSYLPAPRASYVFGVDDSAAIYVESYSPRTPISVQLHTPDGQTAWQGNVNLTEHSPGLASGIVQVPLAHADVGIGTIVVAQQGAPSAIGTRIFIGFGPDLPVLSFRDMLGYLRYFRARKTLQPLYSAKPEERGTLWRRFLQATDPNPSTPQNEALDDYFNRIRDANSLFETDSPRGWLSDRGMVFVTLGAPTNAYEDYGSMYMGDIVSQGQLTTRVRILVWDYNQYQARIIFFDPNDTRQWRMTRPSMGVFQSLLARVTNQ